MSKLFEGPTGRKRLLKTYEKSNEKAFDDLLHSCAVTVEDSLIMGGAQPGRDYVMLDLYRLAMALAIETSRGQRVQIATGIPDSHPHAGLLVPDAGADTEADIKQTIRKLLRKNGAASTRHITSKTESKGFDLAATMKAMEEMRKSGELACRTTKTGLRIWTPNHASGEPNQEQ